MLDFDHVGGSPLRDGVTLSNAKSLAESPGEKGLLGETKVSFVATDAHSASAQREILRVAQDDTDAIDSPVKLWEFIKSRYDAIAKDMSSPLGGSEGGPGAIALAHITPSGDGLRVVVKRTKGTTIEQEQYEWCKAMKLDAIGIKPDAACKDISRLSFAPMQSEVLYYNPSLLFGELPDAGDYPDGSIFGVSPVILSNAKDLAECNGENGLQGPCAGSFASAQDDTKRGFLPHLRDPSTTLRFA